MKGRQMVCQCEFLVVQSLLSFLFSHVYKATTNSWIQCELNIMCLQEHKIFFVITVYEKPECIRNLNQFTVARKQVSLAEVIIHCIVTNKYKFYNLFYDP